MLLLGFLAFAEHLTFLSYMDVMAEWLCSFIVLLVSCVLLSLAAKDLNLSNHIESLSRKIKNNLPHRKYKIISLDEYKRLKEEQVREIWFT